MPPTIASVQPAMATVGGYSGSGNSITVAVSNLPQVNSIADVLFAFQAYGALSSMSTSVLSFEQALGVTYFSVVVPPLSSNVNVQAAIFLSFPRTGYETRSASISSFSYYVPQPSIQSIRWCQDCNMGMACILNGRCGNQEKPLYSTVPLRESGYLILTLQNAFNVSVSGPPDPSLFSLQIGVNQLIRRSLWRISSKSNSFGNFATVVLEFFLGNISETSQCSVELISRSFPSMKLDGLTCFDQTMTLQCRDALSFNLSSCAGPANQPPDGFYFVARVLGPFILQQHEMPIVTFGGIAAISVDKVNNESNFIDFRIRSPSYAVASGSATVSLLISSPDGSSQLSASWTFWQVPLPIAANFDTLGTRIAVLFDQDTNNGGMGFMEKNCSILLDTTSVNLLSGNPMNSMCSWVTNQQFTIVLGSGATLKPNDVLKFLGGKIKSLNGLSLYSKDFVVQVAVPSLLKAPVITLIGPTVVDPCASLTIYAAGISPRALMYRWSCVNDILLDQYLQNLPPASSIVLLPGTPEMKTTGMTYIISAVATDFFGSSSVPATIAVLKQGFPAPSLVFTPSSFFIFRNQPVLISGVAQFSNCPVPHGALQYSWRLSSGPSLADAAVKAVNASTSPQLFLPANSLQAGANYLFTLHLQMASDSTIFSEASCSVSVGLLPVLARIAGGSKATRSNASTWILDASASQDLDKTDVPASRQNLVFVWSCSLFDGSSLGPCTDALGSPLVFDSSPTITFGSGVLAITTDYPYNFTVSVQDALHLKAQNSLSIAVYIVSVPVLLVNIALLSQSSLRGTTILVNGNNEIALGATCASNALEQGVISYQWTISPSPIVNSRIMGSVFPANVNSEILIISGGYGALLPGIQYSISVQCSETFKSQEGPNVPIQGQSSYSLLLNDIPVGGTCSVCLLGVTGCVRTGSAIVDTFRVSCENWADQDNPLMYRFGFNLLGGITVWSAFRASSFVDVVFPEGIIEVFAEVQDMFGASSGVQDVTSSGRLFIGISYSSRRLSGSGINWPAALQNLNDLVSKQSSQDINSVLSSMGIELWTEFQNGQLNLSDSKNLTEIMLTSAEKALSFAVKTSENVCESFGVIESISEPEILTSNSLQLVVDSVVLGVSGRSEIVSLNPQCTYSATNSLSSALIALKNAQKNSGDELVIVAKENDAFASLTYLFLFTATILDSPFVIQNSISAHSFFHRGISVFGQQISVPINTSLSGLSASQAWLSLPSSLMNVVSQILNTSSSTINFHFSVVNYVPASINLLVRSPAVSLNLFAPGNSELLQIENLHEPLNISIPLQKMPYSYWVVFRYQAVCMSWNATKGNYTSVGLKVVNVSLTNVICQANHLAEFIVVQDTTIALPSVKSTVLSPTSINVLNSTTNTGAGVPFSEILAAAGNSTLSTAIALLKWVETVISISQAEVVAAASIKKVGGFGVACTGSVPFLAVPGFIMKTIQGVIYPVNFAVSIRTSLPTGSFFNFATTISAVTTMTEVQSNATSPVHILISGYPLSSQRRSTALFSRRASLCDEGTEWRYTKYGMPLSFACNCPANPACSGVTSCGVIPQTNDSWVVVILNTSYCSANQSNQSMALTSFAQTPTPIPPSQSNDYSVQLGLGLGLGLGIPAALALAYFISARSVSPQGKDTIKPELMENVILPTPTQPTVPTSLPTDLVFSSNLALEASLEVPANPGPILTTLPAPVSGILSHDPVASRLSLTSDTMVLEPSQVFAPYGISYVPTPDPEERVPSDHSIAYRPDFYTTVPFGI